MEIYEDSTVVIEVQGPTIAAPREARAKKRDLHRKWSIALDAESVIPQFFGPDLPCSHEILPRQQYFKQFISEDFVDVIVRETNLYSEKKC